MWTHLPASKDYHIIYSHTPILTHSSNSMHQSKAKYGKQGIWKVNGHASSSHHSIWERSVSSKQCLIGIQSRMGVNLIGLRSLSSPLMSSGLLVCPLGSSRCQGSPSRSYGRPGRRSTPSRQDLVIITYKYRGQSARMHKIGTKEIQLTTKPILMRRSWF